jgi:sulfonate transport system permease protein
MDAELVALSAGLGHIIVDAKNLAHTDIVVVGILVIGFLGMLADFGVGTLISCQALGWPRVRSFALLETRALGRRFISLDAKSSR